MTQQPLPKPDRREDEQADKSLSSFSGEALSRVTRACQYTCVRAKDASDPEIVQGQIRQLDIVLKQFATTQRDIGKIREDLTSYNETLRRARPKGRPRRGGSEPFELAGKWYILDSSNRPLEVTKPPTDGPS